jgi:hypothetical protein
MSPFGSRFHFNTVHEDTRVDIGVLGYLFLS